MTLRLVLWRGRDLMYRFFPVTEEVAGSSLVARAILRSKT
jgi:hypothetical protein